MSVFRGKKDSGQGSMIIEEGVLVLYLGSDFHVRIPGGVWKIGDNAFSHTRVRRVDCPAGLREIGNTAFFDCASLVSVELPSGLTRIGDAAFYNCRRLERAGLPEGLRELGCYAFFRCESLRSVRIPRSLREIRSGTFSEDCSLSEADLPEGLLSIGEGAFERCGFVKIALPPGLGRLGKRAFAGCRDLEEAVLPDSLQEIGEEAFYDCAAMKRTGDLLVVRDILVQCFSGEKGVQVPEGIRHIGSNAFRDLKELKRVCLPRTLKGIGDSAFAGCTSLSQVTLPEGLTSLGEDAFRDCGSIREIALPASLKEIGEGAFLGCRGLPDKEGFLILDGVLFQYRGEETCVRVPDGVRTIGKEAFSGKDRLESVHLPDSVKEIGTGAFDFCKALSSIELDPVVRIRARAFRRCVLLSHIDLPDSLEEIGDAVFEGCRSLAGIRIPDRVRRIGKKAFFQCASLAGAELPAGICDLSETAFDACVSLQAFSVRGEEGPLEALEGVLYDSRTAALLRYPPGRQDPSWRVPEGVRQIGRHAFAGAGALRDLVLPEGLEGIGPKAMEGTGIEYLRLPESLKKKETAALDVRYTGSARPGLALRGNHPVYFGPPGDLPEDFRTGAGLGFLYGLARHLPEVLPWKEAWTAYLEQHHGDYARLARRNRDLPFLLAELGVLSREEAGDLLAFYEGPGDAAVRAVLIQYLKGAGGGTGDLTLED